MARLEHSWALTPKEAVQLQHELRDRVRLEPLDVDSLRYVAGADLSANRMRGEIYVGIVVLELATLETVDEVACETTTTFPYVPGLLSFREIPPLLRAWEHLSIQPDALICDGQGLAHPRRMGLATHTGLALDLPTVGCAKSLYVGTCDEPGEARGERSALVHEGQIVGSALRTRTGVKPVFVSVGHRCHLTDAVELVLRAGDRYRLPEPTRRAHHLVNRLRRGEVTGCDSN